MLQRIKNGIERLRGPGGNEAGRITIFDPQGSNNRGRKVMMIAVPVAIALGLGLAVIAIASGGGDGGSQPLASASSPTRTVTATTTTTATPNAAASETATTTPGPNATNTPTTGSGTAAQPTNTPVVVAVQPSNTPVPVPPTNTPVVVQQPPTNTPVVVLPTNTPLPPTNTPVPTGPATLTIEPGSINLGSSTSFNLSASVSGFDPNITLNGTISWSCSLPNCSGSEAFSNVPTDAQGKGSASQAITELPTTQVICAYVKTQAGQQYQQYLGTNGSLTITLTGGGKSATDSISVRVPTKSQCGLN